jgi:hypothetical protein
LVSAISNIAALTSQDHKFHQRKGGICMAQGGKCPECGYYLFITDEKNEPMGTTVWYECANGECSYAIKAFVSEE